MQDRFRNRPALDVAGCLRGVRKVENRLGRVSGLATSLGTAGTTGSKELQSRKLPRRGNYQRRQGESRDSVATGVDQSRPKLGPP